MGNLAVAVLLGLTTSCFAKPGKAAPKLAAAKVAISSAAAGMELTAYAPSTAAITLDLIALRFAETETKPSGSLLIFPYKVLFITSVPCPVNIRV